MIKSKEELAQERARRVDGNITKEESLASLRSIPGYTEATSWEEVVARRAEEMKKQNWKAKWSGKKGK